MKIFSKTLFLSFGFLLWYQCSQAQQPVGGWKYHLSYSNPEELTGSPTGSLFVRSPHSLYYITPNGETEAITRLDGLSSQEFVGMAFEANQRQLVLAHANGLLDFITENRVIPFFGIQQNDLLQTKKINQLIHQESKVWVAAAYGFSEVDLSQRGLKDSYLNLGPEGIELAVYSLAENDKDIFLATDIGIRFAARGANLKDFRAWQTVAGSTNQRWAELAIQDSSQFALNAEGELFLFTTSGIEQIFGISQAKNLKSLEGNLYLQIGNEIVQLDAAGNFIPVANPEDPFADYWLSANGFIFLSSTGEIRREGSTNASLKPNGPQAQTRDLAILGQKIISLPASYTEDREIQSSTIAGTSLLDNPQWQDAQAPDSATTVLVWKNEIYWGSPSGLWKNGANGELELVDLPNSADQLPISSLAIDVSGDLWIGVFDQNSRLFRFYDSEKSLVQVPGLLLPKKILSDLQGRLWIIQGTRLGRSLRLFSPGTGTSRSFGTSPNQGSLPSDKVWDILLDQRDRLWLGTGNGVAFLPSASLIEQNTSVEAIRPIRDSAPILSGEPVLSIEQSPDDSFFFGTEKSGLWHFSADLEQVLARYTSSNSPIPSDQIISLKINPIEGNLYVLFPQGLVSLRTGIKGTFENLETLKIFPNPVSTDFSGLLTIEGLTDGNDLVITDSAGRPVFRSVTQGGAITWDLRDGTGARITSGVYFVYVYDAQGNQRASGKFLVI
ncbi:type IX secretion system anionic LPS delivery protein PorZ [Algoriphagus namhaensis]